MEFCSLRNTQYSPIERSSGQKLNKEIVELNDKISQIDQKDMSGYAALVLKRHSLLSKQWNYL